MGILREYVIQQAVKKGKEPKAWLTDVLKMISRCKFATHIGKFTHPDSKVSILDYNNEGIDGYVTTGGLSGTTDIAINAAYLSVANLLLLDLENGKTVLENIAENNFALNDELSEWSIDILNYKTVLDETLNAGTPECTEDILKQVYFPIADEKYMLLTVMSPSSLLIKLGNKLKEMGQNYRECRDEKSEKYGQDYQRIFNQTKVGFGGTKPQNISTLNSKSGGSFYMLDSLPPHWKNSGRIPKSNFFEEMIYSKSVEHELNAMNKLFLIDYNNMKIRDGITAWLNCIVDRVMNYSYGLQNKEAGWSESLDNLPMYQKIWLDEAYRDERKLNDEWIVSVSKDFARWLITSIRKICPNHVALGDDEMAYFAKYLKLIIQEEVRYQ